MNVLGPCGSSRRIERRRDRVMIWSGRNPRGQPSCDVRGPTAVEPRVPPFPVQLAPLHRRALRDDVAGLAPQRTSYRPFPRRATGYVRIVDSDVGGRSDDAGGPPLGVVAGPVVGPSLAAGPARGGEVQPGPLHPAAHRGRQPSAQRVQPSAQMRAVGVQDVHDLAAMHRAQAQPPAASTTRDRTGRHRSARAHCRRRRTPMSGRRTSRQHRWPPARGGVGSRGRPPVPAPSPPEPAERSSDRCWPVSSAASTACPGRTATPRVGWCR